MTTLNYNIEAAIENCVKVCGEPAFRGSYAAPREAFRKILLEAHTAGAREESERVGLALAAYFKGLVAIPDPQATYQNLLDKVVGHAPKSEE